MTAEKEIAERKLENPCFDRHGRSRKAVTAKLIIESVIGTKLSGLKGLDLGCAAGMMIDAFEDAGVEVHGLERYYSSLKIALEQRTNRPVRYVCADAADIPFGSDVFDIVICTGVYLFVPETDRMFSEIKRILKPGGLCYFSAANRVALRKEYYGIPLLFLLPPRMARVVCRLLGKKDFSYKWYRSYWGLKRLVKEFECLDFSREIIRDPKLYKAEYIMRSLSLKHMVAKFIARYAYWLLPSYIWVLRKR